MYNVYIAAGQLHGMITAQRHYEYSKTLMGVVLPLQQFQMIQQQHGLLAAVNCSPIPALLQWKNITNRQWVVNNRLHSTINTEKLVPDPATTVPHLPEQD